MTMGNQSVSFGTPAWKIIMVLMSHRPSVSDFMYSYLYAPF